MTLGTLLRPSRYSAFLICILLTALALTQTRHHPLFWALVGVLAALCLLGVYDMLQRRHSILRNFPVIGHVRWMAELVRPEIRQYLIESDEDAAPFSRSQRSLVYMRAKGEAGEHPFGTLKARMGATHFLMKTLPRVASEKALHVLAYNLTRVMNIMGIRPLMAAMRA